MRRLARLVLGVVGYLLSPLSLWNDAFVNVPISLAIGWACELAWRGSFPACFAAGYAATNALGIALMALAGLPLGRRARG